MLICNLGPRYVNATPHRGTGERLYQARVKSAFAIATKIVLSFVGAPLYHVQDLVHDQALFGLTGVVDAGRGLAHAMSCGLLLCPSEESF